ncbi:recombinase family protein [Bacillus pumilus]|uniref:recombinase family protein n=1 Tax=Bacillus pumilus TaxID=1408 RepID=UPI00119F2F63|nr:recombinase family protein [Bacillus pumilus]
MKVCIYARKSTGKLSQNNTIENQIKICKRYADKNNFEVVDIKVDVGTGRDDLNRFEIQELVDESIKGKYECVLMKGISRLYRNTLKGLELIEKFDMFGIRVITIEEKFDSNKSRYSHGALDVSKITMYLMFSEMESNKIGERVKLTQIEKAKMGMWNNPTRVPFGYRYNRETKKLEKEPESASTISLIFKMYEGGNSIKEIIESLEKENKKPPRGKAWRDDTIRYILRNHVYKGNIFYRTDSDKEEVENAHEPIIENKRFDAIQLKINSRAKSKGKNNQRSKLMGMVKCSSCGSSMTYRYYHYNGEYYYYCIGYIKNGKSYCSSHKIKADALEQEVRQKTSKYLNKINNIKELKNKKLIIKNKISRLNTEADMLSNLLIENKVTKKHFQQGIYHLTNKIDILMNEKVEIEQKIRRCNFLSNFVNQYDSIIDVLLENRTLLENLIESVSVSNTGVFVTFK